MKTVNVKNKVDVFSYLRQFSLRHNPTLFPENNGSTRIECVTIDGVDYPKFINEFWTSKQRQASPLHEIAYRACFKPQLPRFFINLLTVENDLVYDPFAGRGTTAIEAGLMGRHIVSNDINPLSKILTYPRFFIPNLEELEERLNEIPFQNTESAIDLSVFYHPETEREIISLKEYLSQMNKSGREDKLDAWIRMVATNRLTGHSPGFFSVYTLPPNQAVTPERQAKINRLRNQRPPYRNVRQLIHKKSAQLISKITDREKERLRLAGENALFLQRDARHTDGIPCNHIQLTVTSPPFLDVVHYPQDNWLRCWFNCIDENEIAGWMTLCKGVEQWANVMREVLEQLFRVTKRGGWVAFEVGEVKDGKVNLDEYVVPLGTGAGFRCEGIIVNEQSFTKTSNIWGITNNNRGTNTNRIVLFHKEE